MGVGLGCMLFDDELAAVAPLWFVLVVVELVIVVGFMVFCVLAAVVSRLVEDKDEDDDEDEIEFVKLVALLLVKTRFTLFLLPLISEVRLK